MKRPTLKIKIKKPEHIRIGRVLFWGGLAGAAALLGALFGSYMAVHHDLPPATELENIRSKIITTVYAENGEPVREFAEERRIEVPLERISPLLIQAILATEDPRFYSHNGVDIKGILRAVKEDYLSFKRRRGRRLQGGSTITQQLSRMVFLDRRQTLRRKLREMFLALKIEKAYSKERILEIYCNQYYLGHGVYGVETAAQLFFGKSASDLAVEEAALIAGIFRGPEVYSPYNNPQVTLQRRNHVINRMTEVGHITRERAEDLKAMPLEVLPLRRASSDFAGYFFEEVRKYVETRYGSDGLYRAGLKIYTTLDVPIQKYAEEALIRQLRVLDKLKGWRPDKENLIEAGVEGLENHWLSAWSGAGVAVGEVAEAIVMSAGRIEASVRVKGYTGVLKNEGIAWTRNRFLDAFIKPGDVIQVEIKAIDEDKKELRVNLEQEPLVEGAFLAIDPLTGHVRAMVGGYSFSRSQWNRATQATRQTGSAIKPFLYTAAIENGFTPASVLVDEPVTFEDRWSEEPWTPRNYDRVYKGAVTLRKGLEESRNVITARLLDYVSPQTGVTYCRRFGITSTLYPYLSLSLGTFGVTLMEMVSGFSVFPNKGVRVKPRLILRIEDKDGNILEENRMETEEVISPQTAYIMTSLLQGVVQRGTAGAARSLNWPLGGKTGTTDQFTDAWFLGFSPTLAAGVWMGYDTNQVSLGPRQTGAVAALPVWMEFFRKVIEDKKTEAEEAGEELIPELFEIPPNLSFADIDRKTGLLLSPVCLFPFREVFIPDTEPQRFCTLEDHMKTRDYYGAEKASEEH